MAARRYTPNIISTKERSPPVEVDSTVFEEEGCEVEAEDDDSSALIPLPLLKYRPVSEERHLKAEPATRRHVTMLRLISLEARAGKENR